ncbi:MAG: uroporphyrinogen-III C-methyltransferase [Pseudomonadota bacterium]
MTKMGRISLVGAGPGDPELLTLKAYQRLREADWILYDRLVSNEIRSLFPSHSRTESVGKCAGKPSVQQVDICKRLIQLASLGHTVCRLKGGDPFVFGRGGEELLALQAEGIDVDVVPGITAALGCAASTQIPLTHRGVSQGFTTITAHGARALDHDWHALVALQHTLVFYMGIESAILVQRELLSAGMASTMPVAIVERGTQKDQRTISGCLHELSALIVSNDVESPALLVIGEVTALTAQCMLPIEQHFSLGTAALSKSPSHQAGIHHFL